MGGALVHRTFHLSAYGEERTKAKRKLSTLTPNSLATVI